MSVLGNSTHNCTLIQSNNRSDPLMNPSCLPRVIYISEQRGHRRANAQQAHFQSVTLFHGHDLVLLLDNFLLRVFVPEI